MPAHRPLVPTPAFVSIRIIALTWSPVTESNRRPSPYHRVSIDSLTRDLRERPDQRLCFSSVGTGSGWFAPDATSQNSSQPVTEEESMAAPRFARPDLRSIRAAAGQAEPAAADRGGFTADGHPLGDDDPPAPPRAASTAPSACPPRRPCSPWRASRRMCPTGTPTQSSGPTARPGSLPGSSRPRSTACSGPDRW
jgi:hypothetical protein